MAIGSSRDWQHLSAFLHDLAHGLNSRVSVPEDLLLMLFRLYEYIHIPAGAQLGSRCELT